MRYELTSEDLASAALDDVAARAVNPEPFYAAAGRLLTESLIPEEFSNGGPPGEAKWPNPALRDGQPLLDSGQLVRTFHARVTADGLSVGTPSQQAALLHFGGTVTPKSGKYLTIPLPTLSVSERRQKKARDFEGTFFVKSKAGNLLLCQRDGKDGLRPLFLLKTSVTVPARPFLAWFQPWVDGVADVCLTYLTTGKA